MSVIFIDVWAAHAGGDERSSGPPAAWFDNQGDAEVFARGKGYYGSDGGTSKHKAIRIPDGRIFLLENEQPIDLNREQAKADEQLRRATLATLSAEQIRVLGLK